jgi:DNA-binding Lrp family transcriptional regulator
LPAICFFCRGYETLDKFDYLILNELMDNARQPVAHIAQLVNLSRTSVAERIKKMENSGVIGGYQVVLSKPQAHKVNAFFEICYTALKYSDVLPIIRVHPEIVHCYGISGETDLLALCKTESIERITEIRSAIELHPNITRVKTHMVMAEWLKEDVVPAVL